MGDCTGDGVDDFCVTAPAAFGDRGGACVFSGTDGRLWRNIVYAGERLGFGASASWLGDQDGDGKGDVLIGVCNPDDDLGAVIGVSGAQQAKDLFELPQP